MPDRFSFFPATTDRLAEIEAVFDDCADARNCRCAYWYLPNADYKAGWGEGNRNWFRSLVAEPRPPGILAYHQNEPAGWCGVAPRVVFDRLRRSKPFAPVDDTPVWSINCFIVRKPFRRQGLSRLLLKHAVELPAQTGPIVSRHTLSTKWPAPRTEASSIRERLRCSVMKVSLKWQGVCRLDRLCACNAADYSDVGYSA